MEERERGREQNALLASIRRAFGPGEVVKSLTVLGESPQKGGRPRKRTGTARPVKRAGTKGTLDGRR